jgi:hypothetical protein
VPGLLPPARRMDHRDNLSINLVSARLWAATRAV